MATTASKKQAGKTRAKAKITAGKKVAAGTGRKGPAKSEAVPAPKNKVSEKRPIGIAQAECPRMR
jgi:hypothetical protein